MKMNVRFEKKLAILVLVAIIFSLFVTTASAVENDVYYIGDDVYNVVNVIYSNGIVETSLASSWCGCDTSNDVRTYLLDHNDGHTKDQLCVVLIREYCYTCGNYRDIECNGIGGCHSYRYLDPWPGFPR